jgi:hypothetical protein
MTAWFDRRAIQSGAMTPERTRKVKAIESVLERSDRVLTDHLVSIETFGRSARKAGTGRVFAEWPRRVAGLKSETLAARHRLDQLNTGLRAERMLRSSLTELASAFGAWQRGLSSSDVNVVDREIANALRHYANAGRLGRAGLADLKAGR